MAFTPRVWTTGHVMTAADLIDLEDRVTVPLNYNNPLRAFTSSDVSTMSRQMIDSTSGTWSSGTQAAARARVGVSATYSKIRFCTGSTAFSGLTDFRAGVWSTADAVLAETANAVATVTATTTVYELSLVTPIALTAGTDVFLGVAQLGTTPAVIRGVAQPTVIASVAPILGRQKTSWAGGVLVAMTSSTGILPWCELVV